MEAKRVNVAAAEGCEISPFCSLENVVLGRGVVVRDGAQLKNVVAGEGTRFSRNVSVYSPDEERPVRIGRQCWLAHGLVAEATGGEIEVGDYTAIGHYSVLLTSSGPVQSPVLDALYPVRLGDVRIGPHCWLGVHTVVLPGVEFAEGVILGAHSMAALDRFEPWSVYGGNPARLRRRMDRKRLEAALKQWRDRIS